MGDLPTIADLCYENRTSVISLLDKLEVLSERLLGPRPAGPKPPSDSSSVLGILSGTKETLNDAHVQVENLLQACGGVMGSPSSTLANTVGMVTRRL